MLYAYDKHIKYWQRKKYITEEMEAKIFISLFLVLCIVIKYICPILDTFFFAY